MSLRGTQRKYETLLIGLSLLAACALPPSSPSPQATPAPQATQGQTPDVPIFSATPQASASSKRSEPPGLPVVLPGPKGMAVDQLQLDSRYPELLLVHGHDPARGRTLYQSFDNGQSWQDMAPGQRQVEAGDTLPLVFDPADPELIYAITPVAASIYTSQASSNHSFLKSFDNSWQDLTPTLNLQAHGRLRELIISPERTNLLYALTDKELLRSEGQGSSWQVMSVDKYYGSVLAVFPGGQRLLWGTYFSNDYGANWQEMENPGFQNNDLRSYLLVPDSNLVLAVTIYGSFLSQDQGKSWEPFARYDTEISATYRHGMSTPAVSPGGSNVFFVLAGQGFGAILRRSSDLGKHWSNQPNLLPEYGELQVSGKPEVLYLKSYQRIWQSRDQGLNWERLPLPVNALGITELVSDPHKAGRLWALTQDPGDLYQSEDGGLHWQLLTGKNLPQNPCCLLRSDSGNLYVGSDYHGVFRSSDGGTSWQSSNQGIDNLHLDFLVQDLHNSDVLFARARSYDYASSAPNPGDMSTIRNNPDALFQTNDGGKNWKKLDLHDIPTKITQSNLHPDLFFAKAGQILQSTNHGSSWTPVTPVTFKENNDKIKVPFPEIGAALGLLPGSPETLIFGRFHSNDGGHTWQAAKSGLPLKMQLTRLLADPIAPVMYGLTADGVYFTLDRGETWQLFPATRNLAISSLTLSAADPESLYLGSSKGLYKLRLDRSNYPQANS